MKIVFLASRFPYPLEKGDKLRAFYQIKELSKKHQVILLCTSDKAVSEEDLNQLKPYCSRIVVRNIGKLQIFFNLISAFFKGLPFQVGYFYSKVFHKKIIELTEQEKPDAVFCQLARMAEYTKGISCDNKMLDYQDAFSKGLERLAKSSGWMEGIFVSMEWQRMLRYEKDIFNWFKHKIIISEQDRDHIPHPGRAEISVIPNGVELDYYIPMDVKKKYDLIFCGNMKYPPNIESALFIANNILPLIKVKIPGIKVVIAGANPAKEIRSLESENLIVTGWVDDMREYLAASKIHLAPMLISIGLQNKILQAMAMKIPNIISPGANKAIHASTDSCVFVAKTPEQYVEYIIQLLNDPELYQRISENAFQFVQQHFKWSDTTDSIEKLFSGK